jgi:hypothetical protein
MKLLKFIPALCMILFIMSIIVFAVASILYHSDKEGCKDINGIWYDDKCITGEEKECYNVCKGIYFYSNSGIFGNANCVCGGNK